MMQFCVLGSGSGGNATIVKAGETVLLVDAGFSAARLRDKMKSAGVEPEELDAILRTHEHTDHMKGVHQFTRKYTVRVYATRHTAMCVQEKAPEAPWAYFEKGQSFKIGDIVITPFATYHDAVDPVGFKFETATPSPADRRPWPRLRARPVHRAARPNGQSPSPPALPCAEPEPPRSPPR